MHKGGVPGESSQISMIGSSEGSNGVSVHMDGIRLGRPPNFILHTAINTGLTCTQDGNRASNWRYILNVSTFIPAGV